MAARSKTGVLKPKVLIVTADQTGNPCRRSSKGEAQRWVQRSKINQEVAVKGHPTGIFHNEEGDLCLIITGLGGINGAVSLGTVLLSGILDLSDAHILISGIGGGNPRRLSIGSVVWATWVVSADLATLVERSDLPPTFAYPYFPLGSVKQWSPAKDRAFNLGTQVFELNSRLAQRAYECSRGIELADNEAAKTYRSRYHYPVARKDPFVLRGDILGGNTFYFGNNLGEWADFWMLSWTDGRGHYAAVDLETNAIVGALKGFSDAGALQFDRVLLSRAPYNYERPPANQSPTEALGAALHNQELQEPALENVYRAGVKVVDKILKGEFGT